MIFTVQQQSVHLELQKSDALHPGLAERAFIFQS